MLTSPKCDHDACQWTVYERSRGFLRPGIASSPNYSSLPVRDLLCNGRQNFLRRWGNSWIRLNHEEEMSWEDRFAKWPNGLILARSPALEVSTIFAMILLLLSNFRKNAEIAKNTKLNCWKKPSTCVRFVHVLVFKFVTKESSRETLSNTTPCHFGLHVRVNKTLHRA